MTSRPDIASHDLTHFGCRSLALLPGLSMASVAQASGETAGLAAGIGLFLLGLIAAFALVMSLVATFLPRLSYLRQLMMLVALMGLATCAFGWLFRMKPVDVAFNFFVLSCIAAALHAGLHRAIGALRRAWRGTRRHQVQNSPP